MLAALAGIVFAHLWTHTERGWMLAIPTVSHGIVYEGTTLGDVLAINEGDGHVVWRASLGANPDETYGNPRGVISSVVIRDGRAYAVSGSCEAGAFDAMTGTAIWKRREIALDAATGVPAWSFTPVRYRGSGGGISGTPAFDAMRGLAIIGTGNPTPMSAPPSGPDPYTDSVIAVDARTGRWRWVTQLLAHDANDFDVFAAPALMTITFHGRRLAAVGVTLKNSRYVMLDERNGAVLWQRQLVAAMHWMQSIGTPATSGDTIVVPLFHGPMDGELVALDKSDGLVRWRVSTYGSYEQPVIWRNAVLVAEANGGVAAFDLRNGRRLGRLSIPSELYGRGLALDGDTLFVAGRGKLWAYRLWE
jgi:outer membrane protein assembly factor BamB